MVSKGRLLWRSFKRSLHYIGLSTPAYGLKMVSKSRQEQLQQLYVGASFGRGIDHDKYFSIGIVLWMLVAFGWYRGFWAYKYAVEKNSSVVQPISTLIHINTAGKIELCLLPGIGPKMADSILDFRMKHGPFESWDALDQVKGIGPKTIENIKRFATLE